MMRWLVAVALLWTASAWAQPVVGPCTNNAPAGCVLKSLTLNGTGTALFVTNNATIGGTLGVTGTVSVTGTITSVGASYIQAGNNTSVNNIIRISPTASGSDPGITLFGPDANRDLLITPLGTGALASNRMYVGRNSTLASTTTLTPSFQALIGQLTGTVTTPLAPGVFTMVVGNDTVDGSSLSNAISAVGITHNYGNSAAMKGSRYALTIQSGLQAGTTTGNKAAGINPFYGVANLWQTVSSNEGGTAPTLNGGWGQAIALNPQLILASGATNWLEASLAEWNIDVQAGASVARKFGFKIVQGPTDAVQGSVADAAIKFGGSLGSVGWKNGLLFGGDISHWNYAGTIIKAEYSNDQGATANTSVWGIDFLEDSFSAFGTGGLIRSQGFAVGGDAKVQIGNALFTPTPTALTIDTSGNILNTSSINAAGSSCAVGDILTFGTGGRAIVATLSGSAVATYTVLNKPYDFSGSPPATLAATAYPASLGPCTGVVFNTTWTAGTTLNFGPTTATTIGIGNSGSTTTITGTIKAGSGTGQSKTCTVNQANTLIFTNGILTGGSCNS